MNFTVSSCLLKERASIPFHVEVYVYIIITFCPGRLNGQEKNVTKRSVQRGQKVNNDVKKKKKWVISNTCSSIF